MNGGFRDIIREISRQREVDTSTLYMTPNGRFALTTLNTYSTLDTLFDSDSPLRKVNHIEELVSILKWLPTDAYAVIGSAAVVAYSEKFDKYSRTNDDIDLIIDPKYMDFVCKKLQVDKRSADGTLAKKGNIEISSQWVYTTPEEHINMIRDAIYMNGRDFSIKVINPRDALETYERQNRFKDQERKNVLNAICNRTYTTIDDDFDLRKPLDTSNNQYHRAA